ncbi:MAG: preprotein translocase subunit SecG [Labilithrix sp.]|nr:preprotein translocase subunit SecG [Labilithrix sp.]
MLQTFINIIHVFVCMVLVGVVLLQQGKGGGMGAAFGGATTQVFGGRGAGNLLTRATAICAAVFMLTSVSLAYLSSSGDRALKAKVAQEAGRKKDKGQLKERAKDEAPSDATPVPGTPATDEAPKGDAPPAGDTPTDTPPTGEAPPAGDTPSGNAPAPTGNAPAKPAPTAPARPAPTPAPAEPTAPPATAPANPLPAPTAPAEPTAPAP